MIAEFDKDGALDRIRNFSEHVDEARLILHKVYQLDGHVMAGCAYCMLFVEGTTDTSYPAIDDKDSSFRDSVMGYAKLEPEHHVVTLPAAQLCKWLGPPATCEWFTDVAGGEWPLSHRQRPGWLTSKHLVDRSLVALVLTLADTNEPVRFGSSGEDWNEPIVFVGKGWRSAVMPMDRSDLEAVWPYFGDWMERHQRVTGRRGNVP